jgi:hypothetical protein
MAPVLEVEREIPRKVLRGPVVRRRSLINWIRMWSLNRAVGLSSAETT